MSSHDPGPLPIVNRVSCSHCDAVFDIPVVIVGEPESMQYTKLLAKLADHLTRKHKPLAQQIIGSQMACSLDFSAIMVSAHFTSLDDGFHQYRETARRRLHSFTRRVQILDATIEEKTKLLGLSAEDEAQVAMILKWLRDLYEEKAQPIVENPTRVVLTP
jgi:hypothetical protein